MLPESALLLVSIGNLFIPSLNISWDTVSGIFRVGSFLIILVPGFLLERRALKNRLQQHQKLLAGDSAVLAKNQPSPNRYALPAPSTIALRPKAAPMYLLSGIFASVALVFAGCTIWILVTFFATPYDAYYTGDDPILAAITGGFALIFGLLVWMIWVLSRYWVRVTEAGLEARFRGRKVQITWSEARFFCLDGVLDPGKLRTYTLSGERKSVSWMQVPGSRSGLYRPVLPFELYLQQSQALLEVVTGQTHLPLYDMRLSPDNIVYGLDGRPLVSVVGSRHWESPVRMQKCRVTGGCRETGARWKEDDARHHLFPTPFPHDLL